MRTSNDSRNVTATLRQRFRNWPDTESDTDTDTEQDNVAKRELPPDLSMSSGGQA